MAINLRDVWFGVMKDLGHRFLPQLAALNAWCPICGIEFSYEQARDKAIPPCSPRSDYSPWQVKVNQALWEMGSRIVDLEDEFHVKKKWTDLSS